jgi:phosphoribosylformylglycinamidine (FGAM) synthase-like enzyme
VSFYNQSSDDGPVFPTPTIGMLGIMKDKSSRMTLDFKKEGDIIFLVGESFNDVNSSEYLYSFHKVKNSPAPHFDLDEEFHVHQFIKAANAAKLIASAHDVSDGGMYITLLESAMPQNFGFAVFTDLEIRKDAFLFGEAQSRVIVSVSPENEEAFMSMALELEVAVSSIGEVTSGDLFIDEDEFGHIAEKKNLYDNAIGNFMNASAN